MSSQRGEPPRGVAVVKPKGASKDIPTFKYLLRRARALGVYDEVRACETLPAVQDVVKRQYRALLQVFHPDHYGQKTHRMPWDHDASKRTRFEAITATYQWFMGLTDYQYAMARQNRYTLPDEPLPWAMERAPVQCPWGYQETSDHLWYQ